MSVKLYSTSSLYIVPLVLIIVFSFFLSGTFEYSGKGIVVPTTPTPTGTAGGPTTAPTTFPQDSVISFQPATLAVTGTGSVTVSLDAKEAEVNAVSLEILYEVDKLSNVTVTAENYLPGQQELTKTVENGKITLNLISAIGSETLPTGVGNVATITFTNNSTASPPTTLTFSTNTTAYARGSSGQNIISTRDPATITW